MADNEEEKEEMTEDQIKKQELYESLDMPLLFDKYDMKEVEVKDRGLKKYINLLPILLPHSGGSHANKRFGKEEVSIIERVINNMMKTEEYTGKKTKAYNTVRDAMDIIHEKTEQNPVEVLVRAIENTSPREETTRITYGGISVPKAVDVSPARRISHSLQNITKGAVKASYKNKNDIAACLADELMKASKNDKNSFAISKKEEIERMAQSAR
ncbi:MAG: 30S ribosomal protein S7, partial [Thermoplasmatota archaeon]